MSKDEPKWTMQWAEGKNQLDSKGRWVGPYFQWTALYDSEAEVNEIQKNVSGANPGNTYAVIKVR